MVAVAQTSPAPPRRLVVVRTSPVVRRSSATVPTATYRRRRLAVLGILVAVVMAFVLAAHTLVAPSHPSAQPPQGRGEVPGAVHVVQPGDTFWGIARALRPNEDPRPLVARMVAAHGSPGLTVGERIRLPAGA